MSAHLWDEIVSVHWIIIHERVPLSNGKCKLIKCSLYSNAYYNTSFIAWPQFVTQTNETIYVLGGPLMTT